MVHLKIKCNFDLLTAPTLHIIEVLNSVVCMRAGMTYTSGYIHFFTC